MRPVAYLSKHPDTVTSGWPGCLCIITTSVLFIKDADKSTLRQLLNITTPHSIEEVLIILPNQWMAHTRLTLPSLAPQTPLCYVPPNYISQPRNLAI